MALDNMITLYVEDLQGLQHKISTPTDMNLNLMEVIRLNELQIKATCGGMAMCATCNILVRSNHPLPEMSEAEEAMLDEAFVLDEEGSRLACQIPIRSELNGLIIRLGELTAE
jgi:2Fe-2S ferredoxin